MHTLSPLYFASSNENKFSEIEKMLNGEKENKDIEIIHAQIQKRVEIIFFNMTIKEIQSDSIIEVAEDKVKKAFDIIKKPVIIEDDGLFIDTLNGFPGVYSSFVFKTIGNKGLLDLLKDNQKERRAKFSSIISFYDGETIESFVGETMGHITTKIFSGGWGFDPIFMPENEDKTYGQIGTLKKNELSHRSKSFKKFWLWYVQRKT